MEQRNENKTELKMIKMSDVQSQTVDWLWYPFIPYGKLTIIQGDPGDGKTTLVLNIAASVYGLVIMLVGLITKLIPLEKVETAADFLVDAMSIMFVPATVGIMASVNALKEMLLPICVITVVSTVLIMIVTGRVSQHIIRGQNNKGAAAMQTVGTEAAADDKEDR